ncbi:MAG: hypothetical protein OHK005_03220 [Candidatus Methylacidiphilales bacterium]
MNPNSSLQVYQIVEGHSYSIEEVAACTGIPRATIALYCREEFIQALGDPSSEGWRFDASAIRRLRQIHHLRNLYDLNLSALRLILDMHTHIEELRAQLRFLHR